MKYRFLATALLFGLWIQSAQATLIYSNDFDSSPTISAGITVSGPTGGALGNVVGGGWATGANGKQWSGKFYRSGGAVSLTLNNLPSHSGVNIDMMLGFLNSWDSRDGSCCSPDNLDLYVDGVQLLNMTTNNALGTIVDFDGGTLLVDNQDIDDSYHGSWKDDLVDMATASALTLAHTGTTLSLSISPSGDGWQGLNDEGWGMDDLRISLTGVNGGGGHIPEPTTIALLGLGLAGIAASRSRKRKA